MAQNTFPAFTDMIPDVEDIQLIMDSLRQEDRYRTTKDGIFNPGIVNEEDSYLQLGSSENSLKIKPFIAYTANGNRIEVSSTWDNLYAQGSVIHVTNANLVSEYENIPVWYSYTKNYEIFQNLENENSYSFVLATLGKGSILHGIKLRTNALFGMLDATPNVWVSIGTQSEPDKFLPETLVSENNLPTDISAMNLLYSIDDSSLTNIIITFRCDSVFLNQLTNGSLTANLCIANLSGFDNSELTETVGGFQLNNNAVGSWQPSTTYHIVARYEETPSNYRQLNYTTLDGTTITTVSEPTRFTTNYGFYALRKTGSIIDYTTIDDIKLGELVTDTLGNINRLYINGKNNSGDDYTQYLTIPGYRFKDGINASQIGLGNVTNEQFSYLSTLTNNVQSQLNGKANLDADNTFTGINTFEQQIKGSVDKVNGFTAYATPTENCLLVLDENAKIPGEAISESTIASIGNFYTVSNGVTTNGRSSFLQANGTTGVVVKASTDNPLVLNYPDGSVEKFTSDINVTGLASSGYYYLVKEKNGNFQFLPTSGGTAAMIPLVSSGNSFYFNGGTGTVKKSYLNSDGTTYKAFDGTINDGAYLGQIVYKNYNNIETTGYTPSETYLQVTFPTAITPTGFAACFRKNHYDVTPKAWIFEATNDDPSSQTANWTQLYQVVASNPSTWNEGEIKTFAIGNVGSFTSFRFLLEVNGTTLNNYMQGEETDVDGVTMPINCYYLQIYATNTDTSVKGNIIEGYVQPTGMSMGSYFLDISKKPYTGYKCVGNDQFEKIDFVKLGFIDLIDYGGLNPQLNCYPFCYNTFSISNEQTISLNTPIYFNHNLGIIPNIINVKFKCLVANNGYSVGDYIDNIYMVDSTGTTSIKDVILSTVTSIKLWPGNTSSTLYVKNKNSGILGTVSNGNWSAIVYCSRGW